MKPVTDPAILAQLNAGSPAAAPAAGPRPVTDPALLAQLDAPPAQPDAIETALRKAQLPGRAVIEGVQDMAGMARLLNPVGLAQSLMDVARPQSEAARLTGTPDNPPDQRLADILGLVQPESAGERVFDAAGRGLTGAAMTGGASTLPALLGGATGGASGQIAKENDVGPLGQLIASLVGGFAPQAGPAAANAIRSTLVNQPATAARIAASEASGAGVPSVAQATGNPIAGMIEKVLARFPGSSGLMAERSAQSQVGALTKAADDAAAATAAANATAVQGAEIAGAQKAAQSAQSLDSTIAGVLKGSERSAGRVDAAAGQVDDLANRMTPRPTPEAAGRSTIKAFEETFLPESSARGAKLYTEVDKAIPDGSAFQPTAAAKILGENATKIIPNPKLKQIAEGIIGQLDDAGKLTYGKAKELRTQIGDLIADAGYAPDSGRTQLKRLYAALSDDIKQLAPKGSAAERALNRASTYWAARMNRIESVESAIEKVGGPEKVYSALINSGVKSGEGATVLRQVLSSLKNDPDAIKALAGTTLARMGKKNPGASSAETAEWSAEKFIEDYDKMSGGVRALFGRLEPGFQDDLAKVVTNLKALRDDGAGGTSESIREAAQKQIQSILSRGETAIDKGKAQSAVAVERLKTQQSIAAAKAAGKNADEIARIRAAGVGKEGRAIRLGTVAGLIGGSFLGPVALIGAGTIVGGANVAARVMTKPGFVKWLAKQSDVPAGALQSSLGALSAQNPDDEDIQAFVAQVLGESPAEAPAQPDAAPAPVPNPRPFRPYEFGIMDNSPAGG